MFDWVYVNAAFKQQKSYDEEGDPKPVFAIFEPYKGFMVKIILEVKYFEYVHYIMWKRKKKHERERKKASKRNCGKYQLPDYKIAPNKREDRSFIENNGNIEVSQIYTWLI